MTVREGRDAFLRTIAQLTAERVAARPIVESLRATAPDVWDSEMPSSWRTAGFVQELTSSAYDILETNPRESLSLAQLALAIATGIPAGTYAKPLQAQLEGAAWKEIGTAHRYLSEYDAALRAYDAAHRAYAAADALAHDDAVVDFARAIVLTDLGRHDEALQLAAAVEPVLQSFDDRRRLVQLTVLTGMIYKRKGDVEKARQTYRVALQNVQPDDLHTRAIIYGTLGHLCAELGDTGEGALMLHTALQLLRELKMPMEVARYEWMLAYVTLLTGEFEKAVPTLRRVRQVFLTAGMSEEAGLAGLDLVDALIGIGQTSEIRSVIEEVLAEFMRAKLDARASTALAYLRDVLPTSSRPQRTVKHVRRYLDRLRTEPSLLFLPLTDE